MAYLYDKLIEEFGKRAISKIEIPNCITDNLKPGFGQREYQIEAFQRFFFFITRIIQENPECHFICCTTWQLEAEKR